MDEDLIDEMFLETLRDDTGDEMADRLVHVFVEDCIERTARINQAYKMAHFSEIELEAHTLGSAARACGAIELEAVCREIEFAQPIKNRIFNDRIARLNYLSEQSIRALRGEAY